MQAEETTPAFPGFPPGDRAAPVPYSFFTAVLPQIERPEELLVSVYFFFAQARKRRQPRCLSQAELLADPALLQALSRHCPDPARGVREGLELAARRGTLLRLLDGRGRPHYALNTPANRRALAPPEGSGAPVPALALPNIFRLYEDNIGTITPLIAEELQEAEERYPWAWIEAAFREAAELNRRNWRYIKAILRRWEVEGPPHEKARRDPEAEWLAERYRRGKGGAAP